MLHFHIFHLKCPTTETTETTDQETTIAEKAATVMAETEATSTDQGMVTEKADTTVTGTSAATDHASMTEEVAIDKAGSKTKSQSGRNSRLLNSSKLLKP